MKKRIKPRAMVKSPWHKNFFRRLHKTHLDLLKMTNYFKGEA